MARASAAARGASISWLARAETRVLALSSPEIYFEISVFVGICGVFSKKNAHTAACTGPKTCSAVRFASFFSVFSCLCRLSHRYLQCFGHLSTFCTCQLRLALVFELCAGVWGGRGDGGGGGDDVHATATGVLIFFS